MEDKNGRENITQSNLCSFKHKGISGSYSECIRFLALFKNVEGFKR
jgi:hypothetical protein